MRADAAAKLQKDVEDAALRKRLVQAIIVKWRKDFGRAMLTEFMEDLLHDDPVHGQAALQVIREQLGLKP